MNSELDFVENIHMIHSSGFNLEDSIHSMNA